MPLVISPTGQGHLIIRAKSGSSHSMFARQWQQVACWPVRCTGVTYTLVQPDRCGAVLDDNCTVLRKSSDSLMVCAVARASGTGLRQGVLELGPHTALLLDHSCTNISLSHLTIAGLLLPVCPVTNKCSVFDAGMRIASCVAAGRCPHCSALPTVCI
jgi:hypothetical protein